MSENVKVPYGDSAGDTAVLLLAAVEELKLDPGVVLHLDGAFYAPTEVVKKAGLEEKKPAPAKKSEAKKQE